ncbi:CPBP family intramembrane glutamic endopeptidase [uncultured Methanobrevibacter sp.]|uniref:CPBP family intramembrane glutamic endopeptidase n=1 Tax=uncultured Methanobrevibacter sp. TaxID=253161 RepID=UPI0025F12A10|nr:type II CAAX endopeptidase family protein [uncultured Methanobrevibacter sp.]
MLDDNTKFPDYITYPRTFDKYKWYRPLLTIIIAAILFNVFQLLVALIFSRIYGGSVVNGVLAGGYETLDTSDVSIYISYLSIFVFIPAIYIANRLVGKRPFSSYGSSRGGWNWNIYLKCLIVPLIIYMVFNVMSLVFNHKTPGHSQVSAIAMIIALILIPAQCIAEEYVFRGILMQSFGAWFKIPILAIIIQAILFALGHSYNALGVVSIGISGILYGLLAWRSCGLEAGAAIHSINNLMSFFMVSLGFSSISSNISTMDFVVDLAISLISVAAVYYIGNKKEWFNEKTGEKKLFQI